jgi:hypothetical protein
MNVVTIADGRFAELQSTAETSRSITPSQPSLLGLPNSGIETPLRLQPSGTS